MNPIKILITVFAAAISTPALATCDPTAILMSQSHIAAKMAHSDHKEHGFVVYEHDGQCVSTDIFTTNEDNHVTASIHWVKGDHMIYFIHTHPNIGSGDERTMSDEDVEIMNALSTKLGYQIIPGIITNYNSILYHLYEYKALPSVHGYVLLSEIVLN